jgi:hypothetical protein
MRALAHSFACAFALCAIMPAAALGRETARISARFTPEHLAAATTVSFAFRIAPAAEAPAALLGIEVAYPPTLGFATSGLGVAACSPEALEALGPAACPPDSRMGTGSALVEIQIGPDLVEENVALTLFAGPSPDGYLHLLVNASGRAPVIADVLLTGVLLPGRIDIVVPPMSSLPEAPYVAVAQLQLTLGGNLTYYEQVGRRRIAYRPPGVGLPRNCPHGGFQFAARFAFLDGEHASARASVACPRRG